MAMPVEEPVSEFDVGKDGKFLLERCRAVGVSEAVDMAMIDASMKEEFVGCNPQLTPLLLKCVEAASQ